LHGRADHEELRPMLRRDAGHLVTEASRTRAHDLPPDGDAVRAGHRGCRVEPLLQVGQPAVHVRVQRQLTLDHERRHEDDAGPPVGGEAAGEIERVLGLLPVEQGDRDAAIGDRARPACEMPGTAVEQAYVGEPHRRSW
jgi:hypothetical protein